MLQHTRMCMPLPAQLYIRALPVPKQAAQEVQAQPQSLDATAKKLAKPLSNAESRREGDAARAALGDDVNQLLSVPFSEAYNESGLDSVRDHTLIIPSYLSHPCVHAHMPCAVA